MRTSIVVIAVLLGVACSPTPLAAQGNHYTLGPTSYDETGCTGPSPCLCPSLIVGFLTGSFDLVPILPPLGPIFEFNVVGFSAMSIAFDGTITTFDGGGTYTIDLANSVQEMILSVDVNGVPTMFQSIGQVPMALGFPQSLEIGVYAEVAPPCIYDGLYLVAETPISGSFIRGDTNEDGSVDIADAIGILLLIFPPAPIGTPPDCLDAMDANDDGIVNIADPISLLTGLFGLGGPPPPPFPTCGGDPTADALDCIDHDACP